MSRRSDRRSDRRKGASLQAAATFATFMVLGVLVLGEVFHGVMAGGIAFVVFRTGVVRGVLLADHRRGLRLAENDHHAKALEAFERSEAAWNRRQWLDRWRGPLLASAGRWGFADQARYNKALCLHSLDRGAEAQVVLQALLERCPNMGMARALAEHIEAGRPKPPENNRWEDLLND